jgi:hypothetical protein
MTVTAGEIIKAVATHHLPDNVISQSVWYWIADFDSDQTNTAVLAAVANKIEAFYADLASQIYDATSLGDVVVNKWSHDPVDGWVTGPLVGVDSLSDTFSQATSMAPHSVAMIITAFTQDVNTRSRKSIGGQSDNIATVSDLIGTAVTALTNALAEWLTPYEISSGNDLVPVVPAKSGVVEYLLYGLISGLVGSQRQRKPGIGV